ncbi:EAL domain-containing protein, partial [Neobacillus niacini]|uniref:sensor domain-containing protein n=1 Tax=Neobacillus niacini TaxID=86668 RepID=UPI003003790B
DKFCELSMYNENELIGQNHRMLKSGYHAKEFFSEMWKTIRSGKIWKGEIRNKAKDGSFYWVDTTIVPFINDKGKPYQYVSIRTDITKRVTMEMELQEAMKTDFIHTVQNLQRELQENQQHYQSLFEHSQDSVFTYDRSGKTINMNPRAIELFGDINETQNEDMIVKEYLAKRNHCFEMAVKGTPQNFEIEMINRNGQRLFLNINFLPIFVDKQIKGVYSIAKDITEQKKIRDTNAYLAHHDELTGLPNRRWIEQKLSESLMFADENKQELAVLFIDLDRFKYINDTLGHFIGDQLLKLISTRLVESIDKDRHFVARMGGDEFMLLCPDINHHEEASRIASIILQNLTNPIYIEDFELFVSASIGISMYPTAGENVVDLMKKADIALYRAKDQGRNTYQMYSTSMDERNYQSFLLERNLRKAIINNEFIVHFQPQFNANTGKIIGAEALIRWMHPDLGLVSPGEFIPLAEESGLIISIGKWMKKRVCEQLVTWREAGIPLIPISVNISSQRFLQKDFPDEVRQLLEEYQLDGKWIKFEITENSLMKHEEYIIQTINELMDLGIKFFIDDFGTGYSSFNFLKMFKLDGIKIDRSFIHNISNESENAAITIAMIKMAHHLKMNVIAEGVETKEEFAFLLEQNCHYIQGFLFGKPCDSQEFEQKFL